MDCEGQVRLVIRSQRRRGVSVRLVRKVREHVFGISGIIRT